MADYVKVLVDIPVQQLDQSYDYRIPLKLKGLLKIGHLVRVPFGRRKAAGFIIGFSDQPEVKEELVKEISDLLYTEAFFDEELLELFQWMAAYYKANLINVIRTAVPSGVISGKIKKKMIRYVQLKCSVKEAQDFIEREGKRSYKQAEVLKLLLNKKGLYTVSELAEMAGTGRDAIERLVSKNILEYIEKAERRRPFLERDNKYEKALIPTDLQQRVINRINEQIEKKEYGVFLLHGVTGSGKTEVYLQVIDTALKNSLGAIVLVPEISLTPMMVKRFYSRFGNKIAVLHSNLSPGERFDEWLRVKKGEASIVIGARSAVFAPVKNPGLIIIDEEHENSYKQGDYPYYHAREVAMKRSKITGATVILGSATPALESYYLARKGVFILSELPDRISQQGLPPVEIVDMREELKKGNTGIFSARLQKLICDALQKKRQAIIFLNRRGYVNFVFCRQCGLAVKCTNCDISLTYHADIKRLSCHYCNWTMKLPETCPECGSVYLGEYGFGTERLEEELGNLFPGAVVERMDIDTVARKGSHQKILSRFENGEIDILVGTQMIAKGHDYPNVAVVGVISADTMLNIPDFRSAERAFQLLTQAAGRTGRGEKGGQVIIQTYNPDHYSIKAACKHDYREFYDKEISIRKQFQYPPFTLLVNIIIKGPDEKEVISSSSELYRFLQRYKSLILEILGPAPAGIRKIRKQYRWQIIMKFNGYKKRNFVLSGIREEFLNKFKKDVVFRIDVDPFIMI